MSDATSIFSDPSSRAGVQGPATDPSLRIDYLGAADLGKLRTRASLDILVPTGQAHLFATFRDAQGRERTAFVRPPLVSIVPPNLPHALADQPGTNTLVLSIAAPFFSAAARAALGCEDLTLVEPHATTDHLIREVGHAVEHDVRGRRRLDPRYLDALASVLAVHVARNYISGNGARAAPCGGLAPHKLHRVRMFIGAHLGETIHVERLAETVHLSPFHFARMFKLSTGQSPHMHILMQRIERAKELVGGTDIALADIAAEVGFRTQGHFTGVFHRYTGLTPRVFRLNAHEARAAEAETQDGR
ncbi:MAG: AraC family transcriptional regulator [Ramlibacter sp.]|nr:AraC family transcriptional regulator [Ramlibacter sp.]